MIASAGGGARLHVFLRSLLPECRRHGAEVVVVRACDAPERAQLAAAYPGVQFVALSGSRSVAELRAAGARAASGDVLAFTEDSQPVGPAWLDHFGPALSAAG